jgi:hypothetical protein
MSPEGKTDTTPGQPVQTVAGVVEADPAEVWDALLATVRPELSSAGSVIQADSERRVLTISGHWWFRGEYAVSSYEPGSMIVYSMFNVAPALTRWLVPLVARRALRDSARPMVGRQLAAIASPLGVRGYLTS